MSGLSILLVAVCVLAVLLGTPSLSAAQTGSAAEPVRYVGGVSIDLAPHDGRLRPAIGVANYQTFRANRTHPDRADRFGWTPQQINELTLGQILLHLQMLNEKSGP